MAWLGEEGKRRGRYSSEKAGFSRLNDLKMGSLVTFVAVARLREA